MLWWIASLFCRAVTSYLSQEPTALTEHGNPSVDRGSVMHQTIVITDTTTRPELEEAMAHIVATLHRMPAHWTDRRAALHETLDALLTDWQDAPHA
ncbi:hypothetical protein [uncultured Arthrobacter sp.]|uniref:hypothetical protein n=1 Tax=uncultured Arthrobacter sp. TaxID=114050 RepID=UPI0025CE8507|nr:hypothetical protein [uncultured Arthrobacter sp.]